MKTSPCYQSGYCCTVAPCPYGRSKTEDEYRASFSSLFRNWLGGKFAPHSSKECVFLELPNKDDQRMCAIHNEIALDQEDSEYPMMGSGCSSAIGNNYRDNIIKIKENNNEQILRDSSSRE